MRKVEIISRRRIFDDIFSIEEAHLRFERHDGRMSEPVRRLNFERGDSVAALVVNAERRTVYLTEQFRYATLAHGGGWLTELVAGSIDAGEATADCIRREIREELGIAAETVEEIAEFFMSPGGTSERTILFCAVVSDADRVEEGGGLAGEHEDIKVLEWPVDEFLARMHALKDAKTLIAGYWLKENLAKVLSR